MIERWNCEKVVNIKGYHVIFSIQMFTPYDKTINKFLLSSGAKFQPKPKAEGDNPYRISWLFIICNIFKPERHFDTVEFISDN